MLPCSPEALALFWESTRPLRQLFSRLSAESSQSSVQQREPSSPGVCQQMLLGSGKSVASCGEVTYAPAGKDGSSVLKLG